MRISWGTRSSQGARFIEIFLVLRMIIAALIFGAGIMIIQVTSNGFPVKPLYLLLALSYAVGGLLYLSVRLGLNPSGGLWGIMMADILLETGIIHYSGGMASQFSLIYCLTIVAGAIMLQAKGGIGTAVAASFCYVIYGVLESFELMGSKAGGFSYDSVEPGILESYMHVTIFILVGAVGGYLAGRIKHKGVLLERAETNLEQLRIDTDNILNHMSSGVLVIDSGGKLLTVNPAAEEILDVYRSEVVAKSLKDAFNAKMPELVLELDHALRAEKGKLRHEITIKNGKNKIIPLGISTSILKDQGGVKRGVIAVFQDLTEVREMQERIRRTDKLAAIGKLSAGIAHEIRNPLASISGSIEMLYNDLKLKGENKRLMELIMRESDRLDRIISDFLEFARMRPPTPRDVSLNKIMEDILLLINNNLLIKKGITTKLINQCNDMVVRGDEEQLRQVFLNLAINACEAMGKVGKLTVTIESPDEKSIKVSFMDDGPGINKEEKDRLFEPFFTTKEGGTGLGLAIANKIVGAHGGSIAFGNRKEGGSVFSVLLPKKSTVETMKVHERQSTIALNV